MEIIIVIYNLCIQGLVKLQNILKLNPLSGKVTLLSKNILPINAFSGALCVKKFIYKTFIKQPSPPNNRICTEKVVSKI